jgi:hypothetical protein
LDKNAPLKIRAAHFNAKRLARTIQTDDPESGSSP